MAEAKDITLFLNPIQKHFTHIEETEFAESKPLLRPLIHVVSLIWANSRYYCFSSKIIVLFRQICNLLIHQAKRYLDPSSIFHSDIDEAMQRINLSMQILKHFRAIFDEYKENIAIFFKDPENHPPILWTFHPSAIFERFDSFLERLTTIQWFFYTVIEFLKLEKVEIGGLKGRSLSSRITAVSVEFNQYFTIFASKTYDVLDPDDPSFKNDFVNFQDKILELDLKLAAILCQAFDDCHNLESVFKLINIVGSVLDRPKIKEEFTNKYSEIIKMLDVEITMCEDIYLMQMDVHQREGHIFVDRSCPPVTASLRWVHQLGGRVSAPVKNFQALQHPITQSEEATNLVQRYEMLMKSLGVFEITVFDAWILKVPETIEENLKKTLIVRNSQTKLLQLNFSPQLFSILKEVHYLKLMEKEGVPQVGIEFSEKSETYRNYTLNLERTIEWYNKVKIKLKLNFSKI